MDNDFYIRFENRFRGPRDVIKKRLAVYWPIIQPLKILYPENRVLDLGCGRGEWLEFLKENGWPALGVDLNSVMVDCCKSFGLEVEQGDLLHYLTNLSDESQVVVSGFHIAEHLTFDDLNRLVREAFRVLKPGGILILETPNPENIIVGSCSFYNDPTHRHPLPPSLMGFLAEEAAFTRVITLRLHGNEDVLADQQGEEIYAAVVQLFLGQPDYALIAQKEPHADYAGCFAHLEEIDRTHKLQMLSLEEKIQKLGQSIQAQWEQLKSSVIEHEFKRLEAELDAVRSEKANLDRYCRQLEAELDAVRSEKAELDRYCRQLESETQAGAQALKRLETDLDAVRLEKADLDRYCRQLESETKAGSQVQKRLESELNGARLEKANLDRYCRQLESTLQSRDREFEQQRHQLEEAVETSRSELNCLLESTSWRFTRPLRVIKHGLVQGVKWPVKKALAVSIKLVSRYPTLKSFAARRVSRFPQLENRLRRIAPQAATSVPRKTFVMDAIQSGSMAEKVYQDLKRAIQNTRGKM